MSGTPGIKIGPPAERWAFAQRLLQMRKGGMNLAQIADHLNTEGHRTPSGQMWLPVRIFQIIDRFERYSSYEEYLTSMHRHRSEGQRRAKAALRNMREQMKKQFHPVPVPKMARVRREARLGSQEAMNTLEKATRAILQMKHVACDERMALLELLYGV